MPDSEGLRWLVYLHPAWMVVGVLLAFRALQIGIDIRKRRGSGRKVERSARAMHLRLGKLSVVLLVIGFVGGPISAVWLRDMRAFATLHAWLGVTSVVLFVALAHHGRALERGRAASRAAHGRLAVAACLAAALTSLAGFVLLP